MLYTDIPHLHLPASTSAEGGEGTDKSGRRCRTKRMRPDFFNSLELEYASKAFRNRKQVGCISFPFLDFMRIIQNN